MRHYELKEFKIGEDKLEQTGPPQHGQTAITHENAVKQYSSFYYCLYITMGAQER
jgi:hypothetical protein